MVKPNSYDDVQVMSEFVPVAVGGHTCVIKQVKEMKSRNGQDMIVVLVDFDLADPQAGYFMKAFNEDMREDKKWPNKGTKYIMVNDYSDRKKVSKDFKTFCTSVEKSNGFTISWGDGNNWGNQFKGKKIGAVYGLVENEYNDKISLRPELRWFCNYDAAPSANIPETKLLKRKAESAPVNFYEESTDEDLPF